MKNHMIPGLLTIAIAVGCSSKSPGEPDGTGGAVGTPTTETNPGETGSGGGTGGIGTGGGTGGGAGTQSNLGDLAAPTVTLTVPAAQAIDIATNARVKITFSEALNASTINSTNLVVTKSSDGSIVPATVSYDATTHIATIAPSLRLLAGTVYQVAVTSAIKDVAGNAMAPGSAVTFTTSSSGFTWVSGSNSVNDTMSATLGVTDSSNRIAPVVSATLWFDANNHLNVFGGSPDLNGYLNTIWRYDGANWTWVTGDANPVFSQVYGTLGAPDPASNPGGRGYTGNVYYSAGKAHFYPAYGNGDFSDHWSWDGEYWTWAGGDQLDGEPVANGSTIIGVPDSISHPGARSGTAQAYDKQGNLYVFGGDQDGTLYRNDLWKFDGTKWTWLSGDAGNGQAGVWGAIGIGAPENVPSARKNARMWIDNANTIWIFGGLGRDAINSLHRDLSDVWKFDGSQWTWVAGSNLHGHAAVYGTKGVADSTNTPGSTVRASLGAGATDSFGNFWLFGGSPQIYNSGRRNDLWMWNGSAWTWMAGGNGTDSLGTYGTKGVQAPTNVPGARVFSSMAFDKDDKLWIFGGAGFGISGGFGLLNDLWIYTP